jgi:methanogenic corrinoid protein MtbC1
MSAPETPLETLYQRTAAAILERRDALAAALVAREFAAHPELEQRYGAIGRAKSLQDAGYHLAYLAEAVGSNDPVLFIDYVAWAKVMLARRGVLGADLAFHLECMREVLADILPAELCPPARDMIERALQRLPAMPEQLDSLLEPGEPHALLAQQYLQALLRGERHVASRLILDAAERGVSVKEIYLNVFQRTQREIGRLWQVNQISVAQEHYCTAATQLIMSQLYPYIFSGEKTGGAFVATCVAGDLHEIGIRMVADFFEMSGWDTFYLGASTPDASVVQTLIERKAVALGISATITYHLHGVQRLIATVRATPACADIVILVGGYPFNLSPELWRTIGADGWSHDAAGAIELAEKLVACRPGG